MKVTAICLLLGLTTLSNAASPNKYRGYETPSYEVVEINADYELRRYPNVTLAQLKMKGATFEEVENTMFQKLLSFFSMGNNRYINIEMTTPVVSAFPTRECAVCENEYEMNFILPSDVVTNPPNPLSGSEITVVYQPQIEVYVRQFQSFIFFDEQWIKEAVKLYVSLQNNLTSEEQLRLSTSQFLAVGYDGPEVWFNRRNEVWIIKN